MSKQTEKEIVNGLNVEVKAGEESTSSGEISQGMNLILSKLEYFLKSQGVETIQTEIYDEDLHEVISIVPSDGEKVFNVVSKGYTLNGKPFRYPKIILGKNVQ